MQKIEKNQNDITLKKSVPQPSAAKLDPFFRVEPDFGPKIRVELGRVGPQGKKRVQSGRVGLK
jgi:hypothetical protein